MNFTVGLSGMQVAQRAIEVIGTNIANASTEGYHRQELVIEPFEIERANDAPIGGSRVKTVRRAMDRLVEDEILSHHPLFGQISEELSTLRSIEAAFGDIGSTGLNTALNEFFGALRELCADPTSQPLRERTVWAADTLAKSFSNLGEVLADADEHVVVQARNLVHQINSLTEEAADLNGKIEAISLRGGSPNMLLDRRDQILTELAELANVQVNRRSDGSGVADVMAWGTSLVVGRNAGELEVAVTEGGKLGISAAGAHFYDTEARGGRLGGLLALKNELLADIQDDLNALAREIIAQVNRIHVQGVGTAGSPDQLTGVWVPDPDAVLSDWDADIAAGTMYLRLIDPTGAVTRHAVAVDPDTDTLTTMAATLNALDPAHLSASVVNSRLHMEGLAGWRFDFLPAALLDLTSNPWTGTATPTASGIYTGSVNETFTFTVLNGGEVGVDADLAVEVRNGAGALVTTLAVGSGYAAGDRLAVYEGLYVAFSTGTLVDTENFTVEALADSDDSGFLAAAGMNTLFSGTRASNMAVRKEISSDPTRVATARGTDQADNVTVNRMADLGEQSLAALGNATPGDFFRLMVTGVGQQVVLRDSRNASLENILQQLASQRDEISGVDVNEEAARLLLFEKMFQAMAKLLNTQKETMQVLVELL